MDGPDEISQEYLHSKLIEGTGRIFLDVRNYDNQGYSIKQVHSLKVEGGSLQRKLSIPRIPLAISVPLNIIMLGILAVQYFSHSSKHNVPEKQDNPATVAQVQTLDKLEDKIQIFFPTEDALSKLSIDPKIKLASIDDAKNSMPSYNPYYKYAVEKVDSKEIAYVNSFRAFLNSHVKKSGNEFPIFEKFIRYDEPTHMHLAGFVIEKDGTVMILYRAAALPPKPGLDLNGFGYYFNFRYPQLFKTLPKFVPPSEANLSAPYETLFGIKDPFIGAGDCQCFSKQ